MVGRPLPAGKLRHRVILERPYFIQNSDTGDMVASWEQFATVWAAIEHISGREFVAAQAEESEVIGRITIRYRNDVLANMRIYHPATGLTYDIQAVLPDLESNRKFLTLPVSQGVRILDTPGRVCVAVTDDGDNVFWNGAQVVYCYIPETFQVTDGGDNVTNSGNNVTFTT